MRSLVYSNTVIAAATGLLTLSGSAFAQSTTVTVPTNTGSSVTDAARVTPAAKKFPISLSTGSWYYGPAVNNMGAGYTPDSEYDSNSPIMSEHVVSLKYKLNEKTTISPNLNFLIQHTDENANKAKVGDFSWKDAYLKLSRSGIVDKKVRGHGLSLDGDLRYYSPTSLGSRQNNQLGSFRMTLYPSIQFKNSRFSIALTNYYRHWLNQQDYTAKNKPLEADEFYAGQQLNFKASEKVNLFVLYENVAKWDTQGRSLLASNNSYSDVEPGVEIQVLDRLQVVPYLNWYPAQSIKTTSINVNANLSVF